MKVFGMALKKWLGGLVLLASSLQGVAQAAGGAELQIICIREQLEIHLGQSANRLNEDSFNGFCGCVATHLEQHLSTEQRKALAEVTNNKPAWLRTAEKNAHRACLKPSGKFST
jgi:hypothetical protein